MKSFQVLGRIGGNSQNFKGNSKACLSLDSKGSHGISQRNSKDFGISTKTTSHTILIVILKALGSKSSRIMYFKYGSI